MLTLRRSGEGGAAARLGPAAVSGDAAVPVATTALPSVAVLLLARVPTRSVPWLTSRLVRGPRALAGTPGLRFARVLGSGHAGGFGLRPGFDRGGLFMLFDDEAAADAFVAASPLVARYAQCAAEMLTAKLSAISCRGSWGGMAMATAAAPDPAAPLAVLTRASIRLRHAATFWRHAAPSQAALAGAPGCRLAVGLGEAPLLRQCTFSLWDSAAAMEAYARRGAHRTASAAALQGQWFSESMFLRLVPLSLHGSWDGRRHG